MQIRKLHQEIWICIQLVEVILLVLYNILNDNKDMKLHKILVVISCLIGFTSCDDFFDVTPKDQLTNETFWKTSSDVDLQ